MEDVIKWDYSPYKLRTKLSPEYNTSEINLPMQMRRNQVKDDFYHIHFKNNNGLRKTIRKSKEASKFNKELLKLQNEFHNMNLKNSVMIKNTMKKIDLLKGINTKQNHIADEYLNECHQIKFDNINEAFQLDCNSENFKVNCKPTNEKLNNELQYLYIVTDKHICNDNSYVENDDNDLSQVKIKCSISYQQETKNAYFEAASNSLNESTHILNTCRNDVDNDVSDLQDLLTMMASSNKTNNPGLINDHEMEANLNSRIPDSKIFLNKVSPRETTTEHDNYDLSNVLNVTSFRLEYNDRLKKSLLKYVNIWKSYVQKKKNYLNHQRQETLNSFFEKLAKKMKSVTEYSSESQRKAKLQASDYNTYQHRYKIQKHIIALQKAKLEEQNRLIEELKYNKIVEASKKSVEDMKEDIRKTYFEVDRHLKPKIKCLTNELKIPEIEEQALVLHCLKVPQFLQRMEKRAREREQKHAMIRERRQQMEEERIRLKQQAELAKAEMDKEEKLKRMKELKQKRKREKIEGIRKKQHAERMRALTVMADLYYEKTLTMKYGIAPFRKLIAIKRDNLEKAISHYKFQLKKNTFLNWMWHTEDMWYERNYKAESFYRRKILKKVFDAFVKFQQRYVLKKQVAEDYYDFYVSKLIFKKFREGILVTKKEEAYKWDKAVLYHKSIVLFKTFICWRSLPALNALRREQEARKARWREKVLQVVPDYVPPDD